MKTLRAAACISLAAGAALSATALSLTLDQCDWIPVETPILSILAALILTWLAAGNLLSRPQRGIRGTTTNRGLRKIHM